MITAHNHTVVTCDACGALIYDSDAKRDSPHAGIGGISLSFEAHLLPKGMRMRNSDAMAARGYMDLCTTCAAGKGLLEDAPEGSN